MHRPRLLLVGLLLACAVLWPAIARAADYAPVDRPGPALSVPAAKLGASLRCPADLASADRDVILLVPPTIFDPGDAYGWNYEAALRARHVPYCDVTVPNHTDGDIQVAAEYVVNAVRTIHAATNRQVIMFGWSQGASTLPRWALRFWPDVRPMVASLVGIAPLNNRGSVVANAACIVRLCVPAAWQQRVGAQFMDALNSGRQVFDGIAYTAIYSRTDDVVTPDVDGSLSKLPPGPNVLNVAIQDVCPLDLSEHLLIPASNTAWTIALDAFEHPGEPADLGRIDGHATCSQRLMPAVGPVELLANEARIVALVGPHLLTGMVPREPPLKPYVFG